MNKVLSDIRRDDVEACFKMLYEALSRPISEDLTESNLRADTIRMSLHLLEEFGIADDVLRFGFAQFVYSPLLFSMLGTVPNGHYPDDLLEGWRRLTLPPSFDVSSGRVDLQWLSNTMLRFERWFAQASLSDIVNLTPPSAGEWEKVLLVPLDEESVIAQYVWLCDRYLISNPEAWATTSLHQEYRLAQDGDTGDFPTRAVVGQPVTQVELEHNIALRAVYESTEGTARYRLFQQVYEAALNYLDREEYRAASTLFRFYLRQYPGDAKAMNACGFCLIPLDPFEAEKQIDQAQRFGLHEKGLGTYNQCLCKILMGDKIQALRIADEYWSEFRTAEVGQPISAVIWRLDQKGRCRIMGTDDVDSSLIDLCLDMCGRLSDDEQRLRWEEGRRSLTSDFGSQPEN